MSVLNVVLLNLQMPFLSRAATGLERLQLNELVSAKMLNAKRCSYHEATAFQQ